MNPFYAHLVTRIKLAKRHKGTPTHFYTEEQPQWLPALANTLLSASKAESGSTGAALNAGEPSQDHASVYF